MSRRAFIAALLVLAAIWLSVGEAAAKGKRRGGSSKAVPALTADGRPNVQAQAAIAIDADNGAEFYSKDADVVRHIASTGKIFVAMVVQNKGLDLDAYTVINKEDASFARGGARTRLMVRHSFRNRNLLHAMLVASDNRAPTALGRAVGLTPKQLVAEMNALAVKLRLTKTKFTDPSGLRGNESTAREMALALGQALKDPVLAKIMSTKEVDIRSKHSKPLRIFYRNTNKSLLSQRFPVIGGKTGFTTKAGYCLLISAKLAGRTVLLVFLGADAKMTRFGDFNRVASWFLKGGAAAARAANIAPTGPTAGAL